MGGGPRSGSRPPSGGQGHEPDDVMGLEEEFTAGGDDLGADLGGDDPAGDDPGGDDLGGDDLGGDDEDDLT